MLKTLQKHDRAIVGALKHATLDHEGLRLSAACTDRNGARLKRRDDGLVMRKDGEFSGRSRQCGRRSRAVELRLAY